MRAISGGAIGTSSIAPGLITGLAMVLLVGFGVRRAMAWHPDDKRRAGIEASGSAAIACGLPMGVFTWAYLANMGLVGAILGTVSLPLSPSRSDS